MVATPTAMPTKVLIRSRATVQAVQLLLGPLDALDVADLVALELGELEALGPLGVLGDAAVEVALGDALGHDGRMGVGAVQDVLEDATEEGLGELAALLQLGGSGGGLGHAAKRSGRVSGDQGRKFTVFD